MTSIMDELSDFHKKIQMYLMKKNQELGELKLLTANITTENNHHVDDICKSITSTFKSYNIPIASDAAINNEKGIQAYKYLLLNTNFENQGRLAEDIVSGHLVDMCPPLSPFLFMQILWSLEYEQILVESLLYLPFDLCVEILKLIPEHLNKLSFERLNRVMYRLIFNVHTKLYQLREFGIQSAKIEDSVKNWLLGSEEFLLLLKDSKLSCLKNVSKLTKIERSGFILQKLIAVTKRCFQIKDNGITISKDLEKLYSITFGREPFVKCEDEPLENALSELSQQLIDVLLAKVKEVDCNTYLAWAEMYDQDNIMISLQRSIGIDCYYFIDFISKDEVLSKAAYHLIECLQHLSSRPDPAQSTFVLSIREVCEAIGGGRRELMDELLNRYKEWDRTILDFLDVNSSLLDKQGCSILLEHLTFILRQPVDSEDKDYSYHVVMKILADQHLPDLYQIVMLYLTKYNGRNCLGTAETCEAFARFIAHNADLRNGSILKFVLLFILKDLKGVLTILLKIAIGLPEYRHIMIVPQDILLVSAFLQMRDDDNEMLLTSLLRAICIENTEWQMKKFTDLMIALLKNSALKLHELVNNVIIAYLMEDTLNVSNMHTILNLMRITNVTHFRNMNTKDLVIALARKMSFVRKNRSLSKYVTSQILVSIARIVDQIGGEHVSYSTKERMTEALEMAVEPADLPHFSAFLDFGQMGRIRDVMSILDDYERRCFCVLSRLKADPRTPERLREYLMDFNLLREDFIHHLIIRTTEDEYKKCFTDLLVGCHSLFDWPNEVEAYYNITRLTIETCALYLAFPSVGGKDVFPFILKTFTRYSRMLMSIRGFSNYDLVYDGFIKNMELLNECVKHSPYAHLFTECLLISFGNRTEQQTLRLLGHKLVTLDHFSDQCHESAIELGGELNRPISRKIINFYISYEVISACLNVPMANEAYQCIRKLNEIFATR